MARTRARHELLQLLYQWQIRQESAEDTLKNRLIPDYFREIDDDYFQQGWHYISTNQEALNKTLKQYLKRDIQGLDPIERAILWIACFERAARPDIHPTITINEAIELSKRFAGEDSYKFINRVLDEIEKENKTAP